MRINADFDSRVVVRFDDTPWIPSPMPGVERKMLDRIGEEVARATSLVRYAPGSAFSAHTHDGGEEYLVIEGTFCDEHGAFPTGHYVRNPPTSAHTPSAPNGAIILVKLHQFDPADRDHVVVDTMASVENHLPLYADSHEDVRIERLSPGATLPMDTRGGAEVFVIAGSVTEEDDTLTRWDWLRLPVGGPTTLTAGDEGGELWIKSGHLRKIRTGTLDAEVAPT